MVATATELNVAVRDFIAHLERGIRVDAAILFGSYVNGHPDKWSDIDLAVISHDFEGVPMPKRQELIADLTFEVPPLVACIGYPRAEYEHPDPASFLAEVIRTGKVVYPPTE